MSLATVRALEDELLTLVKGVSAFTDSGFSVFDFADFDSKRAGQVLPVVGVAYDGAEPEGNEAIPAASKARAMSVLNMQFVIVVAAEYRYTGQDDTKQDVFDLLDQVRAVVLGYKGVNSRPWRFLGERPEAEESGDGVIFYSQVWQTSLPIVGNFNSN